MLHSGFSVHDDLWLDQDDVAAHARLARYCAPCPVALEQLAHDAESGKATDTSNTRDGALRTALLAAWSDRAGPRPVRLGRRRVLLWFARNTDAYSLFRHRNRDLTVTLAHNMLNGRKGGVVPRTSQGAGLPPVSAFLNSLFQSIWASESSRREQMQQPLLLRRLITSFGALSMASAVLVFGASTASAVCQAPHAACVPASNTRTSSLTVTHVDNSTEQDFLVEPDDTDIWDVEVVWARPPQLTCSCREHSVSVTADVRWTGSTWTVSCTGCDPLFGPVRSLNVCTTPDCVSPAHSSKYELIADIDVMVAPDACGPYHLANVTHTSVSIDDGDRLANPGHCSETAAVSPTSQVWAATDSGSFECVFSCAALGPSIQISYD